MGTNKGQRGGVRGLVCLLLVLCLVGCTTMEEKRDKFFNHGKKLYQKADYLRARGEFKNALQIDPKFAEAFLWLGKTELRLENFRNAYGALSQAVEVNPELTEAHILLGQIFLGARKVDEAEAELKLALKQEPQNTEALLLSAALAQARQESPQALELLAEVRRLDPTKVAAYLMQSAIEAQQEKREAAAATLEAGIKANPKNLDLYLAKASLEDAQKQFEKGEATLLKTLSLEPANPRLQNALARHYTLAGQWDKAEEAWRRLTTTEPDKEVHAIQLANFLVNRGRPQDAEKTLMDFISQHPDNYPARFTLADFYFSRRQESRGEKVLQEIIVKDPSTPQALEAKNRLATIRLHGGRPNEAGKLVAEVLKDNPKDLKANLTQGLIALAKNDGLGAVNSFRVLTQEQPQNPEYLLLLARAHLLKGEPELAKEQAKRALVLKADYLEARRFFYDLFLKDKDYAGAIQAIQGFLRFDDKDLFNLTTLGEVYALKGDYCKAKETFQKIINLEPENPLGYYQQGLLSMRRKQPEQALKYFDQALTQQADFLPALQQTVAIYYGQKRPELALGAVRRTLARSPKNPQLHQMLGEILLERKQPAQAAAALEEALALNPGQVSALRLLVVAYQQEEKEGGIRKLEERVANPQTPPIYALLLAMLYERQQKLDKAIALYQSLLDRNLFPTLARNNLAYILAESQPTPENLERALKLASEALEDQPEDPNLLDTMGWILCKQGNYPKAKSSLEQAVEKAPHHLVLLYHLAFCLEKTGDTGKARELLEKALAAKGEFPERAPAENLLKSLPAGGKP